MDEIEEIKSRLNIVDYVGKVVNLSKAGRNHKGLCPFHSEKTPSFIVSEEKQIFHCFGCNEGGDVFEFIMKTEGLDFPAAMKRLAEDAGVRLSRNFMPRDEKKQKLLELNEKACQCFEENLRGEKGAQGLEYLKKRSLTLKTIKNFRLGFAPDGLTTLTQILKDKGYSERELIEAGVTTERNNRAIDQFRSRITFPIMNVSGQVIGFSARVLGDRLPKYINTPATKIYDKSTAIYGIFQAKEMIRKKDYAIIVEGNMDVIVSHQAGIKNVVASSGTALTESQLDILKRFTSNLKLAFDVDQAGRAATRRAIDLACKKNLNLKVIELSEGKDAAEVLGRNPKIWLKAIRDSKYFLDYLFEKIFLGVNDNNILEKKKATYEFLEILERVSEPVEKEHYVRKLADRLKISEDSIWASLKTKTVKIEEKPTIKIKRLSLRDKIEERLLGAAILNSTYLEFFLTSIEGKDLQNIKVFNLYKILKKYYNQRKIFDLKKFENLLTGPNKKELDGILLKTEEELEKFDEETTGEEIFYLIKKIKKFNLEEKKDSLNQQIQESEQKGDQGQVEKLMEKMQKLIKEEQEI